jgi:hypothetical protein
LQGNHIPSPLRETRALQGIRVEGRRVFAKESTIVATIDVIKKAIIIFRALYLSAAPPPRKRTAIVIIAAVEKNKPGLLIQNGASAKERVGS